MKDYFTKGFVMAISSLGVGSGILTQDVLDQLRAVDDAQRITPITLNIVNEQDKKNSLEVLDASMTNFRDSVNELKTATLFDARKATVNSGTSVSVSATENTDIQDFSIDVVSLAKKQIEQSGIFSAKTDVIDVNAGSFDIQVGSGTSAQTLTINYDAGATLDDIKNLINQEAGNLVDASIVQTNVGEFHLFLSSDATGDSLAANNTTDISIKNAAGFDARLTTDFDNVAVQTGTDASFKFNGQLVSRASNEVTDLITGLTLTLKDVGLSDVSIAQDRTSITTKIDSFVKQYNAVITEFSKLTLSSTDTAEKGIFSGESGIKSMKRALESMIYSVPGGVSMQDYGFTVDRDGVMTVDKTVLNDQLDTNPANFKAFFSGGDYTNADTSVVSLTGAFSGFYDITNGYTKTNGGLDQIMASFTDRISSLEDKKISATERLDAKYEIMKKQFAAYDAVINRLNASSDIFTQLANSSTGY
jgi:flagellar hook-associated protein 2